MQNNSANISQNREPTAFERLFQEYDAAKQPFEIITHPYFSTGAFKFTVINSVVDAAGFTRLVLACPRGQKLSLFSYAIEDQGVGAGLSAAFPASDAETNLLERHQTNNEDFAIEGISVQARGVRVSYPSIGSGLFAGTPGLHSAIQNGDVTISDVAAQIIPPEISSPLTLQDALFSALRGKVSFVPEFDRKAVDHIARLDKFPEGGANSYLLANGEPSHHNFFRLHEGYVWRKSGSETDKLFSLSVTMEDDCIFLCTLPNLYQPTTPPTAILGALQNVWFEFTVFLHGRAFYIPSKNI